MHGCFQTLRLINVHGFVCVVFQNRKLAIGIDLT